MQGMDYVPSLAFWIPPSTHFPSEDCRDAHSPSKVSPHDGFPVPSAHRCSFSAAIFTTVVESDLTPHTPSLRFTARNFDIPSVGINPHHLKMHIHHTVYTNNSQIRHNEILLVHSPLPSTESIPCFSLTFSREACGYNHFEAPLAKLLFQLPRPLN
ncbi:hypothetical protein PMIN03_002436 [Paraphaeosphaeria minitans]